MNLNLILEIDETEKYCELEVDIRNRETEKYCGLEVDIRNRRNRKIL